MYPGDCLEQITERPFPYDVILQVEAFTNSTPLWRRRELAIAELYQSVQEHEIKFNTADRKQLQTEQSSLIEDSAMEQGLDSQICNFLAVFGLQLFCNSSVPDLFQGSEFEDTNASSHLVEPLVAEHQHDYNESADDQDQFHQEGLDQKEEAGLHTSPNVTQDMTALGGTHSLYELLDFYCTLSTNCPILLAHTPHVEDQCPCILCMLQQLLGDYVGLVCPHWSILNSQR